MLACTTSYGSTNTWNFAIRVEGTRSQTKMFVHNYNASIVRTFNLTRCLV